MIVGIGLDLVEISRLEHWLEDPGICERFFHPEEIGYIRSRGPKAAPRSLAAGFAAKEAFAKALGTGFDGFALKEIRVRRDESGRPHLEVEGRASEAMQRAGAVKAHLTLTHEGGLAAAQVILEA